MARARCSSGRTRTDSCCSTGNTSRNQPTAPRTANTKPTKLMTACVTSPAASNAMPSAVTKGHTVGAGNVTLPETCSSFCSAAISLLRYG